MNAGRDEMSIHCISVTSNSPRYCRGFPNATQARRRAIRAEGIANALHGKSDFPSTNHPVDVWFPKYLRSHLHADPATMTRSCNRGQGVSMAKT